MFIVVDTETTGLDRRNEFLLEVGCVACDDNLNVVSEVEVVVKAPYNGVMQRLSPLVHEMHTKSGLLDLVFNSPDALDIPDATDVLCDWLLDLCDDERVPMTGSTIDFDREVLNARMPRFEKYFHYRSINVSTIKELVKRWLPEAKFPSDPDKKHRTIADCHATIGELRYYKKLLFDVEMVRALTPAQLRRVDL